GNDERLYLFKIVLPCSRLIRLGSRSEIAFRHPARVSTDRCKPAQPVDWAKISHVSSARLPIRRQIGSNHRRSKPQVLRQSEAQTLLQTKASITPELGKLSERIFPHATPRPAHKTIIDRCRRTILGRAIAPATAAFQNVHDAA